MSFIKIKSLAKDSLIYGISGIVSKLIAVFLVPLYTRIFLPSDYGLINLINSTFLLMGMVAVCSLDSATGRWFYDTEEEPDRKKTFASWFWFQVLISIILLILLLLSTPIVFKYLLEIPLTQKSFWFWLLPSCTLLTNILPAIIWNWYRLQRKPIATILFTLSQSLVTVGLTILFVIKLNTGIKGIYTALFLSSLAFSLIAVYQVKDWINVKYFSLERLKEMLSFSLPLIPASLAFWLLNAAGSFFLLFYGNKTQVGLFSIGASLASIVSLLTGAFQQAWGPFAFSIINEKDAKSTYANVFLIFGVLCSLLVLSIFLFSPELLILFTTPQYYEAAWVASILSINMVLIAFSYIAVIGATIAKNTKHYSVGVILGAVLTVAFNMVLIPLWGKEGAAISMVTAQLVVLAYVFYHSQALYRIDFKFITVGLILLLAIGLGVLGRFFITDTLLWMGIFKKSTLLLMFITFSYFMLKTEVNSLILKLTKQDSHTNKLTINGK